MLGMLTDIDFLLTDAGFQSGVVQSFDQGIIGSFGMVWIVLYYLKPDWFKD
jgi:hypothetical protein